MLRYWIWGVLIFLLGLGSAGAAELELFKSERFAGGPWRIRAEKLTYDTDAHIYEAVGRVEVRQGERRLGADRVLVNEVTKIAWLQGNVVIIMEEDIFTGQEGQFNLATRCGEMHGARLFLKRNHFRIESALIRKTGENSYYAERSVVTTCDADLPAWSFAARTLTVVLEGYATTRDNLVRVSPAFFRAAPGRRHGSGTPLLLGHQQSCRCHFLSNLSYQSRLYAGRGVPPARAPGCGQ